VHKTLLALFGDQRGDELTDRAKAKATSFPSAVLDVLF